MILSNLGTKFCQQIGNKIEFDKVVANFSYSERIMISVDLKLMKDQLMDGVQQILDHHERKNQIDHFIDKHRKN